MILRRSLFPLLALCVAGGMYCARAIGGIPPMAMWVVCLLSVAGFAWRRWGWSAMFFLCSFFFSLGYVRAWLPSVSLLPNALAEWASSLSRACVEGMSGLGLSEEGCSLLQAMLLGDRNHLPTALRTLYQRVGASHILALSGLHLGLLLGVVNYAILHVIHLRWRYWFGVLGLVLIWCYALLTGFPVSLCRASVMISLLIVGQMRMVGHDSWHTLGVTAFLLLMLNPLVLYDVGFHLSFMAVAGLLLFYGPLSAIGMPRAIVLRRLWQLGLVSLAAQMGVWPLLLHYFHRFSLWGVFFSPFYVILATAILYVVLFLLLLHAIGLAFVLRPLVNGLILLQHGLMSFAVGLPGSGGEVQHFSWSSVLLSYVAMLCLLPPLHTLHKPSYELPWHRWAMFFRAWPYLLSALLLLAGAVLFA